MQNTLSLIRQKLGQGSIKSFIENELGVKYRTFVYQCEHGLVPYRMIRVIVDKLEISFDDFKDYKFSNVDKVKSSQGRGVARKEKNIQLAIENLNIPAPKKLSEMFGKKT